MSRPIRLVVAAFAIFGLAACRGGPVPSTNNTVGTDSTGTDDTTGGTQSSQSTDTAGQACAQHTTVDECLADREYKCYWGPNYSWPVLEDGAPCEPLEGMCQSQLSPSPSVECTVDPTDDAACRAHESIGVCAADSEHRCWWTPAMGVPCSPDGSWCPPPPHCGTMANCPPRCTSSGPTISVPDHADCGCLNPPGGVCIDAPGDPPVPSGCVERPTCDSADICSCLTGMGTCTPGELDNVCICDGLAN